MADDPKAKSSTEPKARPLSFPNVDDYECNARWLQIEAERRGLNSTDGSPRCQSPRTRTSTIQQTIGKRLMYEKVVRPTEL